MIVFIYDKTFDGLLTAVFDAYSRKNFPDLLLGEKDPLPLFYEEAVEVCTDTSRAERVWKGLKKKISAFALSSLTICWLSELPGVDGMIFRYIRKAIDAPVSIETDFKDPDVLELSKIWKKVAHEKSRVLQFLRFQKAADGTYFAAMEPMYNVLPFTISHFKNRFADQKWLIYDLKREYGFYYDLRQVVEVTFENREAHLISGKLSTELMDEDEKHFQQLWKAYFKSITIKERINPKLHRQNMPARFWKHLTEKQGDGGEESRREE